MLSVGISCLLCAHLASHFYTCFLQPNRLICTVGSSRHSDSRNIESVSVVWMLSIEHCSGTGVLMLTECGCLTLKEIEQIVADHPIPVTGWGWLPSQAQAGGAFADSDVCRRCSRCCNKSIHDLKGSRDM